MLRMTVIRIVITMTMQIRQYRNYVTISIGRRFSDPAKPRGPKDHVNESISHSGPRPNIREIPEIMCCKTLMLMYHIYHILYTIYYIPYTVYHILYTTYSCTTCYMHSYIYILILYRPYLWEPFKPSLPALQPQGAPRRLLRFAEAAEPEQCADLWARALVAGVSRLLSLAYIMYIYKYIYI